MWIPATGCPLIFGEANDVKEKGKATAPLQEVNPGTSIVRKPTQQEAIIKIDSSLIRYHLRIDGIKDHRYLCDKLQEELLESS